MEVVMLEAGVQVDSAQVQHLPFLLELSTRLLLVLVVTEQQAMAAPHQE